MITVLVAFFQRHRDIQVRLDGAYDDGLRALVPQRIKHFTAFMSTLEPMSRTHKDLLVADRQVRARGFAEVMQHAIYGPVGLMASTETRELIVYARSGWLEYASHKNTLRAADLRMWAVHQALRSDLGIFQPGWQPELARRRNDVLPLSSADIIARVGDATHLNVDLYGHPKLLTLENVSYEGVIFDMDGLLIDSEGAYKRAWVRATREVLGQELTDEQFYSFLGQDRVAVGKLMAGFWPQHFRANSYEILWERRMQLVEEQRPFGAMIGALDLLDKLYRLGIPTAVASSTERGRVFELLTDAHIDVNRIDVIVGGDEVDNGKPAPDIFQEAARRLQLGVENCLVFEDGSNGIEAAIAAKADSVLVPSFPTNEVKGANYKFDDLLEASARVRWIVSVPRSIAASAPHKSRELRRPRLR